MVVLEPVSDVSYYAWPFLSTCYLESFPPVERRTLDGFENLLTNSQFQCNAIRVDDNVVGLLTAWSLDGFRYIEHFAVNVSCRGLSIGSKALHVFLKQSNMPVVLEVEPPLDEQSRRRVHFYEKSGFRLSSVRYIQPPYSPITGEVELRLMEWNGKLLDERFEFVEKEIHTVVYGVTTKQK